MKNTLENKAKFFAQYYGVNVLAFHPNGDTGNIQIKDLSWHSFRDNFEHSLYLQLRPLSLMTDDEAIEVASFMGFKNGVNAAACRSLVLTLFVIKSNDPIKYELISKQFLFDFMDIIVIGDKLRSFGFAIPFQDVSVEQLIEYGWIKVN